MKFNIRRVAISYSKICAKNSKNKNDLSNYDKLQKYNKMKSELEEIYEKFVKGAKVRSKWTWYEEG